MKGSRTPQTMQIPTARRATVTHMAAKIPATAMRMKWQPAGKAVFAAPGAGRLNDPDAERCGYCGRLLAEADALQVEGRPVEEGPDKLKLTLQIVAAVLLWP